MSIETTPSDHRDADHPGTTEAGKPDDLPLGDPTLVEQRLDGPPLGDATRDDPSLDAALLGDAPAEDSRLYAPRPGLRPFRQGELDALCGLYAILNAARWAAWPSLIEREMMETLFARLSTYAVNALPLPSLCSSGITVLQLRKL